MSLAQPTVKVYALAAQESRPVSSKPEHADIHTSDGVPAEVAALVSSQVTAVEGRLMERVDVLEKQVADLRRERAQASRPWYRQPAVLISLGALLLIVVAIIFNYLQVRQNDEHNARIELRDLTQRLSQISAESINATQTSTNSVQSGLLQQENAMLARQAEEVINEIPDSVSSGEYILVAQALMSSNLNEDALNMVNKATGAIQDANEGSAAYSLKGQLLFNMGDPANGRQAFQQALDIFKRYPTTNTDYQTTTTVQNELAWTSAEYGIGQCAEAKKHIDHAWQLIQGLGAQMQAQPLVRQLISQAQQQKPIIDECSAP
jgi:tetratricopeptide (TPR) repeat protein